MKFTGNTNEFLELTTLEAPIYSISPEAEESSLTIMWFRSDNNEFVIDGKTYSFSKNQIIFLTEFHKVITKQKGSTNYIRFNRSFYCIIDHDTDGLLAIHHRRATRALGGVLATDQVAFDENLLFDRRQVGHLFGKGVAHLGELLDRRTDLGEQIDAVVFLCPTRK